MSSRAPDGAARQRGPSNSEATSVSPAAPESNGAPAPTRPTRPRELLAGLVMAPDPRTGAQMVTLTFVLPPAQILIVGAPHPYLVELHAALSELAADLADVDKVRALVAFRGVDADELSDHIADAAQLVRSALSIADAPTVEEPWPDDDNAPLTCGELRAIDRRLAAALDILTRPAPPPITHAVTIPPGLCLANRADRKHEPSQPRAIGDSTCRHCGAAIVRIEGEWFTTAPDEDRRSDEDRRQADGGR